MQHGVAPAVSSIRQACCALACRLAASPASTAQAASMLTLSMPPTGMEHQSVLCGWLTLSRLLQNWFEAAFALEHFDQIGPISLVGLSRIININLTCPQSSFLRDF